MGRLVSRRRLLAFVVVAFVAIQWIGPARTNPPIDPSVALEASAVPLPVGAILHRACYDCHSSETRWPWYSQVAPASWLVIGDVVDARKQMSFSRWRRYNALDRADLLDKVCEQVTKHHMPLWQYTLAHRDAKLSKDEISAICAWTKQEAARLTQEE